MVKKCIPLLLAVVLLFSGCGGGTSQETQPTGYTAGVHQPQVMYQGTLYYYQATGFDETIPPTFSLAGTVAQRSDLAPPQEDWCSGLVEVGAGIYADENNPAFIYVEESQGIAKFSSRE